MANTYSQINIHAVFAVKHRNGFLLPEWRRDLFRYISGIISNETDYSLAVGGWLDHVHVFFEHHPSQCVADVLRVIKANSSKWINDQALLPCKFNWQSGYGAFSYSRNQRSNVIGYIENQESHHAKTTFRAEYLKMLNEFEIDHDPKYLFEFFD